MEQKGKYETVYYNDAVEDAAEDLDVVSIKMTLYRVADRSKIIEALFKY